MNVGVFFGLAGGLFAQFLCSPQQAAELLTWASQKTPDARQFNFTALDGSQQRMVLHREHIIFGHTFTPQPVQAPQPSALGPTFGR